LTAVPAAAYNPGSVAGTVAIRADLVSVADEGRTETSEHRTRFVGRKWKRQKGEPPEARHQEREHMAGRGGNNGFGRHGRLVVRVLAERPEEFDVVAINDLSDAKHLALLLKYDSVHGRFNGTVEVGERALVVNGKAIRIVTEKDPAALPWKDLKVQVALES